MRCSPGRTLAALLLLLLLAWPAAATDAASLGPASPIGRRAASFEANRGQAPADVAFRVRGSGAEVDLTPRGASFWVSGSPGARLLLELVGGTPDRIVGRSPQLERSHYLIGPREGWVTGVPHFARVRYEGVYPGVDLAFYGKGADLEYDFIVAPGADPGRIRLAFEGAERIERHEDGSLLVHFPGGTLLQRAPLAYQESPEGEREIVVARQVLEDGRRVSFELDAYDPERTLVIDPVLVFSGVFGGGGVDAARALAIDASGFVYMAGEAEAADSLEGPPSPPSAATDAFVRKLDPKTGATVYTAFFGGSGADVARGIALDAGGNVYIVGTTWSDDLPVAGATQATRGGDADGFLAKLAPDGQSVTFATYIGGSGWDSAQSIGVDSSNRAVVYGDTESNDLATVNAPQASFGGLIDTFVARYEAAGSPLVYLTYLGGTGEDNSRGTTASSVVDDAGNVYLCGTTKSLDFPMANALQPVHALGGRDGFVTKLDPAGAILFSTFLGGGAGDSARGIALAEDGSIYLTGGTRSFDFPLVKPLQPRKSLIYDAFVVKLSADAQQMLFSTYLGGSDRDMATSIVTDANGAAYVLGHTLSADFPLIDPVQNGFGGGLVDAFVAKLTPTGSAVVFSTTLGGAGPEVLDNWEGDVVITANREVVVTGVTSSSDFPLAGSSSPTPPFVNAFLTTFAAGPEVTLRLQPAGARMTIDVEISNLGPANAGVEVRAFAEIPGLGATLTLPGEPTGVVNLAPGASQTPIQGLEVDDWFATPGTRVGARLLEPATGRILAESVCEAVPCN